MTGVKLNNVIDKNPKLIDKLWLKLYAGDGDDEKFIDGLKVVRNSRRRYKQLFLHFIKANWFHNQLYQEVLMKLGQTVTALATDTVKFECRRNLVDALRLFPNLRRLQLKIVVIEGEAEPEKQCLNQFVDLPHLADLYLVEYYPWICNILSPCVNIQRLESYILKWTENDVRPFENLLFSQRSLKKLRLGIFRQGRLFNLDRSSEVHFQLENLLLNGAFYVDRQNLLNFVQTQTKLKKLQINLSNEYERRLDNTLFYNETLKFIFSGLPELHSFGVHQDKFKFPDFDFLTSLPTNKKIENLHIEGESVDIFTALVTSILPNVKNLCYEANLYPTSVPSAETINQMQNLESLVLDKFFVGSLKEIHITNGRLRSFEFIARWVSDDFEANFRIFMQRHPTLKRLRIGVIKFLANLLVTITMCEDIVTNLTQLESLNVQNFEDINSAVPYLVNNLETLRSLEVSAEQYKDLTRQTFDDCFMNGVGIVVGK